MSASSQFIAPRSISSANPDRSDTTESRGGYSPVYGRVFSRFAQLSCSARGGDGRLDRCAGRRSEMTRSCAKREVIAFTSYTVVHNRPVGERVGPCPNGDQRLSDRRKFEVALNARPHAQREVSPAQTRGLTHSNGEVSFKKRAIPNLSWCRLGGARVRRQVQVPGRRLALRCFFASVESLIAIRRPSGGRHGLSAAKEVLRSWNLAEKSVSFSASKVTPVANKPHRRRALMNEYFFQAFVIFPTTCFAIFSTNWNAREQNHV